VLHGGSVLTEIVNHFFIGVYLVFLLNKFGVICKSRVATLTVPSCVICDANFNHSDTYLYLYHKTEVSSVGKLFTRLQCMLKVATVFTNTHMQLNTSLPNSLLDHSVVEVMPLFDKMLLKVVDTVDPGTVDSALQHVPDLIVDWIKVWAVR